MSQTCDQEVKSTVYTVGSAAPGAPQMRAFSRGVCCAFLRITVNAATLQRASNAPSLLPFVLTKKLSAV